MNIVATIQARMGSSRLPGKVLKEICGKPLLQYQIERIKEARLVDDIIIATSTNPKDDAIVKLANKLDVKVYRGSENDVLSRIVELLKKYNVEVHVELIGDSPLADPQIIDEVIGLYLKNREDYDYVSNGVEVSYPAGMEVNVYHAQTLIDAESNIFSDDPLREHVDIHLSKNPTYKVLSIKAPKHFYRPDIFLEVDTLRDFEMISTVINHFIENGKDFFSLSQILDYLKLNPDVVKINQDEDRRYWQFKEKPTFYL